ncbi:alpha/beta fold hydrolase [Arthrobacter sp. MMS18-M83]|uniref:alpha/beta fold hydrolase n=1 Tax=Arthrobacter sp. MMS18-M83 TaxID=2996261 RepID=UPI00227ACC09|nr:alpha/beta hydrolase [Arthrobacter sp. MMS18-M83]WAH97364.1 alpha/beta hydrolase [Arthrobacter sp. MMS18-M83]
MLTETSLITEETILVANLETRYLAGGPDDGVPIVFLHDGAWGGASDVTWSHVLPLAAEKFRVIAPDFLGYGGSAKSIRVDVSPFAFRIRHMFSLLDSLGVTEPVHLVGNSFGGSIGLRALADEAYRGRIASVTTINGTGGPWKAPDMAKIGDFDGTRARLEEILDILCDPSDGQEAQLDARFGWAAVPGHFTAMRGPHMPVPAALRVERPADPYPAPLQGVATPVLLVECTGDTLLESGWSKALQAVLPNAQAELLPYKHCPNITHPRETWDLIGGFLDSTIQGGK